jgi:hypothetical protein
MRAGIGELFTAHGNNATTLLAPGLQRKKTPAAGTDFPRCGG